MSSKDSSQIPSWGSPAQGAKWGSPAANLDSSSQSNSQPNSPNLSYHTPKFPRHQEPCSYSSRHGSGGDNALQNSAPLIRRHFSTPPSFSPRPLFHSSPMNMNLPSDNKKPKFGQNRNFHRRGGMSPHSNTPNHSHQASQLQSPFRRSFANDSSSSMNNPGGSSNIEAYYHPSMLDDPWKDLPATPMTMT